VTGETLAAPDLAGLPEDGGRDHVRMARTGPLRSAEGQCPACRRFDTWARWPNGGQVCTTCHPVGFTIVAGVIQVPWVTTTRLTGGG
jgi:hypothetical protein